MRGLMILAAALGPSAATSQTTNTQCRWIGSIWSCDSRTPQQSTAPVDQAAVLRSGMDLVPDYAEEEARKRELRIRERELKLREREMERAEAAARQPLPPAPAARVVEPSNLTARFGLAPNQVALIQNLVANCPKNDRTPMDFSGVADSQRAIMGSICFAFDQGKVQQFIDTQERPHKD